MPGRRSDGGDLLPERLRADVGADLVHARIDEQEPRARWLAIHSHAWLAVVPDVNVEAPELWRHAGQRGRGAIAVGHVFRRHLDIEEITVRGARQILHTLPGLRGVPRGVRMWRERVRPIELAAG